MALENMLIASVAPLLDKQTQDLFDENRLLNDTSVELFTLVSEDDKDALALAETMKMLYSQRAEQEGISFDEYLKKLPEAIQKLYRLLQAWSHFMIMLTAPRPAQLSEDGHTALRGQWRTKKRELEKQISELTESLAHLS